MGWTRPTGTSSRPSSEPRPAYADGPPRSWDRMAAIATIRSQDPRSGREHLAQHELQDAAVPVVVGLARGVDAHHGVEGHPGVRADLDRRWCLTGVQGGDAGDAERLLPGQAERLRGPAGRVL